MSKPMERRQVVQGNKDYGNPYKSEKISKGSAERLSTTEGAGVKRVTKDTPNEGIRVFSKESIVGKLERFEVLSNEVGNPKVITPPVKDETTNSLVDDILGGE